MKTIGIDIGTTGICGVLLDAETGEVLQSVTKLSDAFLRTPTEWEKIQNVLRIESVARNILDGLLEGNADVVSIGLTGQMHGIVYLDGNGRAVSPLFTWQDERANLPLEGSTYAKTLGIPAGYGNATDFYNRKNGLIPRDAVTYCTVHDYVGMSLCGRKTPLLHASDAASFGLYDVQTKTFQYDYHPAVTDGFDLLGTYHNVPVSVAIGDNQASVFATLANEDDLLVNVGTGSQVSVVTAKPISAVGVESRPYVDGKTLAVGAALCGGRAFSVVKHFFEEVLGAAGYRHPDVYRLMDALLEEKRETTLSVDTRFAGTRQDPNLRGVISGISEENFTPADLCLGVLRGMAEELHGMYLSMKEKRRGIVGSGNGVRKNPALMRILQETFGGTLRLPVYREEAACGAALFSLVAAGVYPSAKDVQKLIRYTEEPV